MPRQHERSFDALWWNAFRVGVGVAVAGLAAVLWLGRPAPDWAAGLAGAWVGGQVSEAPLWRLHEPGFGEGATREEVEGTTVLRTGPDSWIELGHLGEDPYRTTWSGWWRVDADAWPGGFLAVSAVESDRVGFQMGFRDGYPALRIRTLSPDGRWREAVGLTDTESIPLRRWVHLAATSDGRRTVFHVDGRPVAEKDLETGFLKLGRLRLTSLAYDDEGRMRLNTHRAAVHHDGLLLHERRLDPAEIRGMAAAGRSGWADVGRRRDLAAALWRVGGPLVVVLLAAAVLARVVRRWSLDLAALRTLACHRSYRAVRWTLAVGILSTAVLAGGLHLGALRSDLARLRILLGLLASQGSEQWKKLDLLLVDARTWAEAHPSATLGEWEEWLDQHHYPADFHGVRGVGLARRVLPEERRRFEDDMSARHGFPYFVKPFQPGPAGPVLRLEGNPSLPVVLYKPEGLEPARWRSNDTILGRDLLSEPLEDVRPWSRARVVEEALLRFESRVGPLERTAPAAWYGSEIRGLRLFVPWVLRKPAPGAERLAAADWEGVFFADIDFAGQAAEAARETSSQIGFRVWIGDSEGGRHEELFDSGRVLSQTRRVPGSRTLPPVPLAFFHRKLVLEAWTTPEFERDSLRSWVGPAAVAGLLLTGLAAGLVAVQVASRERQGLILGRLQEAHSELQSAQLQRTRLSRDIHDSTLQNLYAVGLHLRQAAVRLPPSEQSEIEGLRQGERLVQETIVELREFLGSLREEGLAGRSFGEFVGTMLRRLGRTTGVGFELSVTPSCEGLSPVEVMHLANIVREAISNALRHGRPSRVAVSLEIDPDSRRVRLQVKDDGTGFDAARPGGGNGLGLRSMRERAEELGGSLDIRSAPGSGTELRLEFVSEGTTGTGTPEGSGRER